MNKQKKLQQEGGGPVAEECTPRAYPERLRHPLMRPHTSMSAQTNGETSRSRALRRRCLCCGDEYPCMVSSCKRHHGAQSTVVNRCFITYVHRPCSTDAGLVSPAGMPSPTKLASECFAVTWLFFVYSFITCTMGAETLVLRVAASD